jgi:hypothetical protein
MEQAVFQNNDVVHQMADFALKAYASKSNVLCDSKFSVTHVETQVNITSR